MNIKMKPRKPVNKISDNQRRRLAEYGPLARRWKKGRDCDCSGLKNERGEFICREKRHKCAEPHHFRGRLGPLLTDTRFFIPVCRKAHRWIDANRAEARLMGLLCDIGQFNTPVPL